MSTTIMFRKCVRCGKKYKYNPSVGDFGLICKNCGWPQTGVLTEPKADAETGKTKSDESEEN